MCALYGWSVPIILTSQGVVQGNDQNKDQSFLRLEQWEGDAAEFKISDIWSHLFDHTTLFFNICVLKIYRPDLERNKVFEAYSQEDAFV